MLNIFEGIEWNECMLFFPPWKMVIIDTCLKYGINIRLKDIHFAVKLSEIEREIVIVEKTYFFLHREDLFVS